MKLKTFILTFLMMMSCSILFGQELLTGEAKTESKLKQFLYNEDYGTITIGDDFSVSSTIEIPKGRKITIDLNGHKLTTNADIYIFKNFGRLTITDNSTDGKGTISSLGIYNGKPQTRTNTDDIDYTAQLTIKGGVFENISPDGGAAIYNHLGVIDIQGGEFYGEYSAITNFGLATIANAYIECLNRDNGAAAIINDFEIEYGNNVNVVGRYTKYNDSGTASITDGEATYLFAELNGTKYTSLQAALDACTTGDNTINLLFHNSDNATVSQKEGVNITIVGNGYKGKQFEYSGTIYVNGNNRYTGNETLTIQNVNFTTNEADHDFISANVAKEYAHNLTVKDCDFTATGAGEYTAVAMRFRQAYNIKVDGGRFTKLHSVMWATGGGGNGITVEDIDAESCKNGVSFGTSTPVAVKNSTIDAEIYAVRADGSGAYSLTVANSTLSAEVPVIVRETTGEYDLTVAADVTLTATNGGPQVVVTKDSDDDPYVAPTAKINVTLNNDASTFGLVAKIGYAFYATLQDAIDNAIDGDVVTLIADVTENEVLITQKADVDVTIDGNDKTFTGHMTIFGSGRHTGAETLTIQNVVFQAVDGKGECIASATNINGVNSYAHNVTVEGCTFKGNDTYSADNTFAIRFPSGGVGYDLTVTDCTADEKMFGLLWVTQVVGDLIVDNCTAEGVKEGIVLTSTTKATITNTKIDASTVAIRAGQQVPADGKINEFIFNNNTLKSDAIAIQLRGDATDANLSMTENVVSGTTHISGNTADTKISADANYWDGQSAPVVAEGSPAIVVNSYYADEARTQLVRNEMGSINAFVSNDRIFGDVTTNAGQSLVINIIGKDGNVIGTTSCEKPELMTGFNNLLTWRINFGADDSGSWAMTWNEGNPSVNNMPEKVELYVDGDKVAEADVNYTANGDGASPVFAVRTDNNGKILGSIANTGKYNLYDVAASFNNSIKNDVNTGETIELIANVSATETIWISKSITINGNENSVTSNANRIFRVNASNIKVTLNDVKMVSTAEREGTNDVRGISIDPGLSNIELTLNNSSVDFTPDSANDWSYAVNVAGNGTGHKVTVNSGTYEGANVINVHGANNKVVVKDAVLTSLYPNNDKYYGACIWVLQNQDSSVEATGNTFNGSNTVAFNLGTGTELVESDNTDNTTCMVAKIGDTYYTSVEAAINAAADGATVQLLERVIDETIAPWTGNPQHNLEKSITIQGYSDFGTILTGGMYLGYEDSQCREHNIVVKGVKFTGKGLTVACQQNVTIEGNKFNNITEGRAIAVIGKNVNSVITNNVIDGVTTSNPGIELRNTLSATVKGNTISNTGHNALQITSQVGATNSSIVVENNTLSNWGTADNSNGEKEGRAMRINGIVTAQINGNVMSHTAAPEEFVKITGTTAENIDASKNYWNADNPFGTNMFLTDLTSDPAAMLKNYYTDVEKTNLVTINSSVAKIGDVYYTTFADALEAVEDGKTITLTGVEGSESGEIEYTKDIEFTITGEAPNYALPVVTFQNATVNIKDAEILIPELDARQNATINVIDSKVYDAGGNSIAKSYYNGALNISGNSVVYMMQVTTMGYINISGTAKLHATWQTNVYGNGLVTIKDNATFNTAALHLTGQDYSGRDNTDADRVGKPAEIVVDGANFTVGKVYSESGADYSYHADEYGINVGTIEGKSAILTIKNGGNVNIYTGDGKTANIGADGTVNIEASTFNVECRAENGTATLANNGTVNVTGAANLAAANVTGNGWFYMNGVTLDADTKLLGAKVRFASGTNNIDGSTIDDGFFQVGIGAYNGTDANVDTENGVVVNVINAVIGANGDTYAGWAGTGFYDTDTEKAAAMTSAKYVLNIENSIAEFGYLHISNDGELNVNGNATEKAWYNNSDYSFYAGDFIINGTATFDATDVLAIYTKVSCDNGTTDNPGTLNIVNGTEYEAERHNADIAGTNFILYKTGVANVAEGANLHVGEPASIAADATMNIGGTATVLGELTNDGTINFTSETATLTVPTTGLEVNNATGNNDIKVVYENGAYKFIDKHYVAEIVGGAKYESLAEAATAAQDGETIQLLWNEGDAAISMAATFVGNKTVTIKGTADVDWSNGFFFVGRNGEGDGKVIFDNANLTSGSNSSAYGFNVSGSKVDDNTTNNGIVEIKNSTIVLDYMLNKNVITLDKSTLTVKNGFSVTGRKASESATGEDATATMTLSNNSKVVVNNMNGMGIGHEAYGIMNIDATSTFETTQYFNISAKGTMNVNGGNVNIAGTLTNAGTVYVTGAANLDANVTGNGWFYMNGVTLDADTELLGAKVGFINGENNIVGSTIKDGWFNVGIGNNTEAENAQNFATANGITLGDVTVNVSNNATVYTSTDAAYSGWVGSAYSADKDDNKKYILNINNSLARFGYMHVSKDGEMNVTGPTDNKYEYAGNAVDFYAGTFINNGNVTLNGVDAWAQYTKISVDHADAVLNITNGTKYEANCTTGNVNANTFLYYNAGTVNIDETSSVNIEKATKLVEGAVLNIASDNVIAKGAVTGNGTINLTDLDAIFTAQERLTVVDQVNNKDYKVVYKEGAYQFVHKDYVAQIDEDNKFETLQEAFVAAQDGDEIVVLKDIVLTEGITVAADDNMTLDLNGKTISMQDASNNSAYAIKNNGNLTIKDSAEGGMITFNSTTPDNSFGYATSTIGNGGHLTIENGLIENTTVGGASYAVDGIWHTGEASLTINDGTITATEIAVRQVPFSATAKNTVTINGGILTGATAGLQMFNINNEAKLSETIIKGGEFNGTYAFYTTFTSAQASELATINIDGGTFNGYVFLYNGKNGSNAYPMTVAITDGLFNSGAYIYTKDANGNEVPIKAITGGTFSVDPSDYCAEGYGVKVNGDGTYSVIMTSGTQEIALAYGWNWFSSYIDLSGETGLEKVQTALGTNGVQIKGKFNNNSSSYQDLGNGTSAWIGDFDLSTKQMYMINTSADVTMEITGNVVDREETTISLGAGWNWISYPLYETVDINEALANHNTAADGDAIKTLDKTSVYYSSLDKWIGDLTELTPGQGYMYKSANATSFVYSAGSSRSAKSDAVSENKFWKSNVNKFANNMTIVAMLSIDGELVNDNYEIAAFANGECRGSARPVYVEELDQHILFLTINGEDVQELTFKYYDVNYGTVYELNNRINYSNDAVLGSIDEPYMFNLGILNIEEATLSDINIYPNPTTTGTEINLNATCDTVEVFNALGVKVAEYQNVDTIDALETAGIYVIRITNNGNVQNCRLVVK